MKIPKNLVDTFGQAKIDESLKQWQTVVDDYNKASFENAKDIMKQYIISLVGGKIRVIDKYKPMENQMDFKTADEYFEAAKIEQQEIKGISAKNGELTPEIDIVKEPLYQAWRRTATRYDGLIFRPDLPHGKYVDSENYKYWNTWRGWAVQPDAAGECDLFLDMIRDDICNGNMDAADYILDWFADMIQNPHKKNAIVPAIRGLQGGGKNTLFETMVKIMGKDYACSIDKDTIVNHFNSTLYGKILVVADEAVWSGDRSSWGYLKQLTGSNSMLIESKGKDKFVAENYIHLAITTNEDYVAPIEQGNRRYLATTTSSLHIGDVPYWAAIYKQLEEQNGYAKLMYILQNRKIKTNFYAPIPCFDKSAVEDSRLESLSSENPVAKWLYMSWYHDCLLEHDVMGLSGGRKKSTELYYMYQRWSDAAGEHKTLSQIAFSKKIKNIFECRRTSEGIEYEINRKTAKPKLEKVLGFMLDEVEKA